MILLIDAEIRTLGEISHPLLIKPGRKLGLQRDFFNLGQGIYEKPTHTMYIHNC
jgi:hypothetical protein